MTYKDQLLDPRWQKKRLEILSRDKFTCQLCLDTETTLHIHHKYYDKTYQTLAWEYPNHSLLTICSDCHVAITKHVEEYGNDEEFATFKVKKEGQKKLFVYTKGMLRFDVSNIEGDLTFTENTANKVVQFLIHNWLKHG